MFAAVNTVEPPILDLANARFAEGDKPWSAERLPLVKDRIRGRLKPLSAYLGKSEWLDGEYLGYDPEAGHAVQIDRRFEVISRRIRSRGGLFA